MVVQSAQQTSIGAYRIFGQLGSGELGVVYVAQHESLGRKAAVKVLSPELTGDRELVLGVLREAQAAAATEHPGIVKVYDFGYRDDGIAYIATEFLEGESLAARLVRLGQLPVKQALRFAGQMTTALSEVHQNGIIHCVLKPSSIFIVQDPTVPGSERAKILDFGVAKLPAMGSSSLLQGRAGAIGAPEYMAPEQCRGGGSKIDHRADLYALGCILFEMLCGRPPFNGGGGGPAAIMAAHLDETPPSPRSIRPNLPRDLDAVLNFLLAKNPERRYPSAKDVGSSLAAILREPVLSVGKPSAGKAAGKGPAGRLPLTPPPPTEPRMPGDSPDPQARRGTRGGIRRIAGRRR